MGEVKDVPSGLNMADDQRYLRSGKESGEGAAPIWKAESRDWMIGDPVDGIEAISRIMSRMRVLLRRRLLSQIIMKLRGECLDLAHLDVLDTVHCGQKRGEVTVGQVAERLSIDPSRSSRLVSDLVKKGILRRAASQEDARRTVLELTETAREMMRDRWQLKERMIREVTADWSEAEIASFASLFARFVNGFETRLLEGRDCSPNRDK